MSIITAITNATKGTLADQYKEIVSSGQMGMGTLVKKGVFKRTRRSSNKGGSNVITDGSAIIVGEGECMLLVENGEVVDFCNEPGQYVYRNDLAPSMLTSGQEGLKKSLNTVKNRIIAGGQVDNYQKVYYVNTKEIMGNKFGVGGVPFRDGEFDFTIKINAYGLYSYKITDPLSFFVNVTGSVNKAFTRDKIDNQFKSEVQSSFQPALGRLALNKIAYDKIPLFTKELTNELNLELKEEWVNKRGLSVESFSISSITPDESSFSKIEEFQSSRIYTSKNMLGARLGTAQADAIINASKNEAGAINSFLGMGMANQYMGGSLNIDKLLDNNEQDLEREDLLWVCSCGHSNKGKFCSNCGEREKLKDWKCTCGQVNEGNFCINCGKSQEDNVFWKCSCGEVNEGKFCSQCGNAKFK